MAGWVGATWACKGLFSDAWSVSHGSFVSSAAFESVPVGLIEAFLCFLDHTSDHGLDDSGRQQRESARSSSRERGLDLA